MKTKEEALKAVRAYYEALHKWDKKLGRDLQSELSKIINHDGDMTNEQRAIIGVAMVLCEKYGLDKVIGDLGLPAK